MLFINKLCDVFVLPEAASKRLSLDTWLPLATALVKELCVQYPDGIAWSVNTGYI